MCDINKEYKKFLLGRMNSLINAAVESMPGFSTMIKGQSIQRLFVDYGP